MGCGKWSAELRDKCDVRELGGGVGGWCVVGGLGGMWYVQ